jgi:excisionase family DNA binding protein
MTKPQDITPLAVGVQEAARMLGVGRTSLYQLVQQKRIASFSIGARRLFKRAELERFIEQEAARNAA